ncbi:MAG: IS21-like element helper ATPase IstB [Acidobacteriota bacterium]|nr:IS21-like element helper ATPase IstB [Acidobacteriota bacterium]
MTNSRKLALKTVLPKPLTTPTHATNLLPDLPAQLRQLNLRATAEQLDDILARAARQRLAPRALLEELAARELADHAQRNLERLLAQARLGRFRHMADFDWSWPKKIDRPLIERALSLEFIHSQRNLILLGTNGLGKTMIAKNIAYAAVQAGHRVLFRTASEILTDLACDSPQLRRRKFNSYARPALLVIDEVGYLAYDAAAADLLYEVVNRRYERCSILITSNRAFKTWNEVFPNATCIATLLDRLTHHADITTIEGQSYRVRESEQAAAARRNQPYVEQ